MDYRVAGLSERPSFITFIRMMTHIATCWPQFCQSSKSAITSICVAIELHRLMMHLLPIENACANGPSETQQRFRSRINSNLIRMP
jgi:hypothetical protein